MAAHVLHIGMDDCHRVDILRSAGYKVDECASLHHFAMALEVAQQADAVILTESENIPPEQAFHLTRERSTAPVIFFRSTNRAAIEDEFDLVIPPLTAPEKWLKDVNSLLEWSRTLRAQSLSIVEQSRSLRKESATLRRNSERVRERSVIERARNSGVEASDAWKSPGSK